MEKSEDILARLAAAEKDFKDKKRLEEYARKKLKEAELERIIAADLFEAARKEEMLPGTFWQAVTRINRTRAEVSYYYIKEVKENSFILFDAIHVSRPKRNYRDNKNSLSIHLNQKDHFDAFCRNQEITKLDPEAYKKLWEDNNPFKDK